MSEKDWKKQRRFRQGFASLLQKILKKPLQQTPYTGPLHSVVILAQEKYGDAILLTPLLKQLKQQFPAIAIHVVTFSKATYEFFRSDRHIDTLHCTKGNVWNYYRQMLTKRFDLLFNTKDHPSTSFILQSIIIRAYRKAGIDCEYHRGIYDYLVDLDFHTQIALKNCGLLSTLGKPVLSDMCRPYIPPMPVSPAILQFITSLSDRPCIGINISAGGATRYWTEENWLKLTRAFPERQFLVLSAPTEREQKARLERHCPNIIPSPETANLYETNLIVGKTVLLVTPDTAMVHVASCSGIPVIGLYGIAAQDQSRFRPFLVTHRMLISPTALVKDITAEHVIVELNLLLGK